MQYSVVNYNEVLKDNELFRIDSDYFRIDYLSSEHKITSCRWDYLGNIAESIVNFGAYSLTNYITYLDAGVPFLNVGDIKENFIDFEYSKKIDPQLSRLILKKSLCKENQVLLTIAGTIGNAAVVHEVPKDTNSNQAIANITVNKISPFFLSTYLNCFFGKQQTKRLTISSVQPNLLLTQVKKIKVPIFSKTFQTAIEKLYKYFHKSIKRGNIIYSQAEKILLSELGLLEWKPKHELTFIKNFSDTQNADRIDAEYFQPKYDELIEAIKKYKGGFVAISDQFKLNKKSFKKVNDKQYHYIEISCVNVVDGSIEPILLQGAELPANAKINFQKHDVIVSKVRPYRGAIGIVDCDNYIGSGAFTVLHENGFITKEMLMVFLRLKPLLDLSLKYNTGTSYPTITDDDILNLPLPKIDIGTQNLIKEKITEAYSAKKLSKSLLEIAKKGVEKAIEEDEKEAEKLIDSELDKLNIKISETS